jgi:aspartate beta-hydroxylase
MSDLSHRITTGLVKRFEVNSIDRVLKCFERFNKGEILDINLGNGSSDHNRQVANCWVDGIPPSTFYDTKSDEFKWVANLEKNSDIIAKEFSSFINNQITENNLWLGARDSSGHSYGPQWKTLGLQDRSAWDSENVKLFPKTIQTLQKLDVPSCEMLFASQGPTSGILPHSDFNNFILTCHLGIQVEKNKAWIRVGDDVRYWENGKALVFDTSVYHSTRNDAETTRYVLMIRFWHPNLTYEERKAFE